MRAFPSGVILYKLWKPKGALSALDALVPQLLPGSRANPADFHSPDALLVGRLDKDSDGLLLMACDEGLSESLLRTYDACGAYVGSCLAKRYRCRTNFPLSAEQLDILRQGVPIVTRARRRDGEKRERSTLPCEVEVDRVESPTGKVLHITLREGRNRQLRKMIGSLGHRIDKLRRVGFGSVTLDGLAGPGSIQPLTDSETSSLLAARDSPRGRAYPGADDTGVT